MPSTMKAIGLIGGTGDLGRALAIHFAKRFDTVYIGSRSQERADAAVKEILSDKTNRVDLVRHLIAASNEVVAQEAETVIATVPFENALETVTQLAPKFKGEQLFISAAAPVKKKGSEFVSSDEGSTSSLSEQLSRILPKNVTLATAFQTVPANVLYREKPIRSDVLITCDAQQTFELTAGVVSAIEGLRPLYVGSLALSGEVERLTSLLLNIAVRNHLKSPTFQVNSF